MKNSAVRALVREQFNIPQEMFISINCLAIVGNMYEFEVEWWDNNDETIRYQSNFKLPHIEVQSEMF